MACRYTYEGKTYSTAEFMRVLSDMQPAQASRFMSSVASVPNAPFVNNTDEWALLAFKRMARWAVDNGFDRIAWTTGDQQAERYDLSKQVRRVEYTSAGRLIIDGVDGRTLLSESVHESKIEDYVGKEVAKRLLEQKPRNHPGLGSISATSRSLTNPGDLRIGGDGMRAFYDNILPKAVAKWAKKFGGKITSTALPRPGEYDVDGTDVAPVTFPAHAIDITPDMRDAVLGGQPLFSLSPSESIDAIADVMSDVRPTPLQKVKGMLGDKWTDWKRPLLATLQLRHLIELATEGKRALLPIMKGWADTVQKMATDRQALMDEVGPNADAWRAWAYGKGALASWRGQTAKAKAHAKLMHDATQLGVDPAADYQPLEIVTLNGKRLPLTPKNIREQKKVLRDQMLGRGADDKRALMDQRKYLSGLMAREKARKAEYPKLLARYQALAQGEPDWFVVRDHAGLVASIHPTQAAADKAAGEVEGATIDQRPAPHAIWEMARDHYKRNSDRTMAAVLDRIKDLQMPEDQKRRLTDRLRMQFETNAVEGVYFPLFRTGDYYLSATREVRQDDGSTKTDEVFSMFETPAELRAAEEALRGKGYRVKVGLRNSDSSAKNAVPGTFAAEVVGMLQKSHVSEKVQDEVWQLFLRSLPEMSMRKHQIHRRNVAGFDADALRAFSHAGFHGAHQLARLRYSHILEKDLQDQEAQLKSRKDAGELSSEDSLAADRLLGEIKKRHEWIMSPKDSAWANKATGIGFIYYLGVTPAAALVNLLQGPMVTLPVLGARYGWPKAMRALGEATWASIRTMGNIERTLTTDEERAAYQAFRRSGAIEKTQVHSLAGLSEGDQLQQSPAWQKTMHVVGALFQKMEVINREAAAMAAFRLAREAGQDVSQALKYGLDIVNGTHLDYSNANRSRVMQNNLAKVAFLFKSYGVGMTWVFWRGMHQALRGETAEVKRLARRQVTGMLGMTGLFAGVMGLPLINVIKYTAQAAQALFGDDDEPWDFDTEFRAFMGAIFGTTAASVILDGVANQAGANIAGRVGMSDLLFREPDRELEGRDQFYYLLEQAVGPMGGIGKNMLVGMQQMNEGHLWRGVETMMPKVVKDGMKAIRFADEGATSLRGDPIMEDVTAPQAIIQAIGFSPTALANQYRVNRALKNYEQHIVDRRSAILNAYALAVRGGAGPERGRAMERIREWNRKYPEFAITAAGLRASLRSRARYSDQADNGIVLNPKIAARVRAAVGVE